MECVIVFCIVVVIEVIKLTALWALLHSKNDCVGKELCTDFPPFLPYIPTQN